jgi:hypothetical protein
MTWRDLLLDTHTEAAANSGVICSNLQQHH